MGDVTTREEMVEALRVFRAEFDLSEQQSEYLDQIEWFASRLPATAAAHEATEAMLAAGVAELRFHDEDPIGEATVEGVYRAMERARVAAAEPATTHMEILKAGAEWAAAAAERGEFDESGLIEACMNGLDGLGQEPLYAILRLTRALHDRGVSMAELVRIATGGPDGG